MATDSERSEDDLMTVEEVAHELGCSPQTVRGAYQRGYLKGTRRGKRLLLFRRSDVTNWSQSDHRKRGPKKRP